MTDQTLMTASPDSTAASDGVETPAAEATEANTQTQQDAVTGDQPQDTATEGDEPKDGEDKGEDDKDGDEPKGAPDEYEEFSTPEGVELDADTLGSFKEIAKEFDLPQAQAQKLVDLGAQMAQRWADKSTEAVTAMHNEWLDQAKGDKEFGGEALNQNLAIGKKALDAFGTDELRGLLEQSRLGDHPEVIRFFVKVGKAISEDSVVTPGGEPKGAPKSLAERIFDNTSQA